jgi:hypothetical protein
MGLESRLASSAVELKTQLFLTKTRSRCYYSPCKGLLCHEQQSGGENMKYLKMFGLAVVAASALMAVGVSSASATDLEIGGVKQEKPVEVTELLKEGTSALLSDTSGFFANTCTERHWVWHTNWPHLSARLFGTLTSYRLKKCKEEEVVVDTLGEISVENIAGTTNGTIRSIGTKMTSPSPFGTLTCVTASGEGTDMGTLTGVKTGRATMDISATLNCGAITAKFTATSQIVTPEGLGVTS